MEKIFFDNKLLIGVSDYIISYFDSDKDSNLVVLMDDFIDISYFKENFLEYKELVLKYRIFNFKKDFKTFLLSKDKNNSLDYESIIDLANFYKTINENKKICFITQNSLLNYELPEDFEPILMEKAKKIELDDLLEKLITYGYRRVEYVEMVGEFAVRGNIIDIWGNSIAYKEGSCNFLKPLRILIDDENKIESIRLFNPSSQRSTLLEDFLRVDIYPVDLQKIPKGIKLIDILDEKKYEFVFFSLEADSYLEGYYPNKRYYGNLELFEKDIKNFILEKYKILIGYQNEYQLKNIKNIVGEYDNIELVNTSLSCGFFNKIKKLLFITYDEIFSKFEIHTLTKTPKIYESIRLENIWEIQPEDYVVHFEYGIAKFLGTKRLTIRGITKEFLVLQFRDNAILYLSVSDINQIEKYISLTNKAPNLSSLSKESWEKIKLRIKESLKEFIIQLYSLYSERKKLKGYQYKSDKQLEEMFASTFEYEETEDQLKAIEDVYRDMESEYPMDRIIVGDVGFGKTEVALRATFKAVINKKQVIVLCPTTVLAHQHFVTFSKRLEPFGIKVALVSRLKSKKEIKEIFEKLKNGEVDVVIGTHILLSDEIDFFDLGLIIIDEEHKFGVKQKEKIRLKYKTYERFAGGFIPDVLYLTATPIPRTLAFGLEGIKDISIIEIPPQGRQPIETFVLPYSKDTIIYAITKELQRDGQVYYIFNDIEKIIYKVGDISKYFPNVKIEFIHSKLPPKRIEDIMIKFLNKEIQILVSTTIIEAGLDIPNVNTIIIEEAHKFGLAQLYQLRGRVGRRDKKAYCYFLYSKENLTLDSKRRLSALMEFTSLGSGYYLALRDLEIRGAGEILGTKQHGFVNEVGLNMYSKIIKQLLYEITTKKEYKEFNPVIDLMVEAYIPEDYIKDVETRTVFYRKLLSVSSYEEIKNIKEEMYDRFGEIKDINNKKILENLLYLCYFKLFMKKYKIERIYDEDVGENKKIFLVFKEKKDFWKFKEYFNDSFITVNEKEFYIEFKKQNFSLSSILNRFLEIEKSLTGKMNT
ncbi:MAG: helicase-related protein [Elusimicrobiota bacterium]|nr:helicase-related protein [Endomicrobiia bacterium]MDW8165407.1 helicase-related protein [Elusimicrobiota bacterium]